MADAWLRGARDGWAEAFVRLSRRYAHLVGKPPEAVADAARQARQTFVATAEAVGLMESLRTPLWRAWLADDQADPMHPRMPEPEDAAPAMREERPAPARAIAVASDPLTVLASGLQDATTVLLEGGPASNGLILDLGLETLQRAWRTRRVWLVTPGDEGQATARRWLGSGAAALAACYRIALPDVGGVIRGRCWPCWGGCARTAASTICTPSVCSNGCRIGTVSRSLSARRC